MSIYKKINKSDVSIIETTTYKKHTLSPQRSSSVGLQSIKCVSGSSDSNLSSSFWDSLHVNFYLSGSSDISKSFPGDSSRFRDPFYTITQYDSRHPIYLNKFFKSASIVSIPQQYVGDGIRKGSFVLKDTQYGQSITIKDDSRGNLYAPDATISHSSDSTISSSINYVGNIFYDYGIITLTETGSFYHVPTEATFVVQSTLSESNHFFVTGSDLSTSIKFEVNQDGSKSDTDTIKYWQTGSNTRTTQKYAKNKINSVFTDGFITASQGATTSTVKLTNDRQPNNPIDRIPNYPPITGSVGMTSYTGFTGGSSYVSYMDLISGSSYSVEFDSIHNIYTREYTVTIDPGEFNRTMNVTARGFVSGSDGAEGSKLAQSPYLSAHLTSSDWNPYITKIHLYDLNKGNIRNTTNIQSRHGREVVEPVIVANLPRPVKIPKNISLTFKIRLDM